MELILAVPHLLAWRDAGTASVRASALAELLATAGPPLRAEGGIDAALASRYGVLRQADWPLAPIRLAAQGVDPGEAFWFVADPVTLTVGRDDVRLAGIVDDLDRADTDALIAALNAHFAADGIAFVAPRPGALFVRVDTRPRVATHPPASAAGRPLRMLQPRGPDAALWRRWQSEIQMLLHEHPVNAARERAGRPAANCLWLSCGGILPRAPAARPSLSTFADAGVAVALAAYVGSPARAVPSCLARALDTATGAEAIVVALPGALEPAAFERAWATPALAALDAGRLRSVRLLADDAGDAAQWHASRAGPWERLTRRFRRRDLRALLADRHDGG